MSNPLARWFKIPTLTERLRSQGVREDLVQAADRTAFGKQTDSGIPALGELLDADERVISLVEGRMDGAIGLLTLTSRRLLFAPKGGDRSTVRSVSLADLTDVRWRRHRGLGVLELSADDGDLAVDQILGNQAETLGEAVRQATAQPPDGPAPHRDPLEELAELRALHRAGAVTDAEFEIRKQQLFGQI
jgi:hypothetical protein